MGCWRRVEGGEEGEEVRKRALSHPFRGEMTFRPEKGSENWREMAVTN